MMRIPYSCINTSDLVDMKSIQLGVFIYNDTSTEGLSNLSEKEEYRTFYLRAQFATGLILYPIICLFGLCGNCLSIVVLSLKRMRTPTNIYLISLAIADSIKLVNDMLYFVCILTMRTNPPLGRTLYAYLYPYAHYFFHMSVFCSAWITVSVAVERYILVCHAMQAKRICSFTVAKLQCCLVFLATSLLTIPLSLRYQSIRVYNQCEESEILEVTVSQLWKNKTFSIAYTWLHNSFRTVVPIITVTILNYFIVKSLKESRRRRRNATSLHRITIMLVSVIVVFIVCVTPDAIISTIFGYGYYEANYLVRAIREVTDLLLLINSATNFILYCSFNYVFRKNFMAIFCTLDPHRSRVFKRDVTAHATSVPTNSTEKGKLFVQPKPKDEVTVGTGTGGMPPEVMDMCHSERPNNCHEEKKCPNDSNDIFFNEERKNPNWITGEVNTENSDSKEEAGNPKDILVHVQMCTRDKDDNYYESSF